MRQSCNINQYIWIKLTKEGKAFHYKRHIEWEEFLGNKWEYKPPKEDEKGWSKWQMHEVMHIFGPLIRAGRKLPFETEIQIEIDE